ncbi:MAG TPA: Fe-S cluster assembly protein SufD [Thermoanaerobaculia bacterium]
MIEAIASERSFSPEPLASAPAAPWLGSLRRRAFARFEQLGFPTAHDEAWRYTGVQPITDTAWTRARHDQEFRFLPPAGVRVSRLPQALAEAEPLLGRIAEFENDAFTALNTASFEDAIVLEILPGAVIAQPIEIVLRSPDAGRPEVSYPRVLVLAGARSQASLVQTFRGEGRSFTNAVTEISLGEGAILEHTLFQRESATACHVHTLAARQARGSRLTSHNIALGAALARTNLNVVLAAEGAECALYGLFVGKGAQHLDLHTLIDHASPRCVSRELYKGILDGAARGVFHGTILVRAGAQKTDAVQTNKNLLLSGQALVNSTPALEILADDVKCRHGSTTGQLDAAALFYLRARGIGEEAARALLTWAFAADVAERIAVPSVRAEVERELGLLLAGAPPAVTA